MNTIQGNAALSAVRFPMRLPVVAISRPAQAAAIERPHPRQTIRAARRLLLAQHLDEALIALDRAELSLTDLGATLARRMRADIDALRAVAAMFRDDSASALRLARHVVQTGDATAWASAAARAVCQFACWRMRDFETFHELPWHGSAAQRHRLSFVVGQCIDGAIELEQLRLTVAKRLASDVLEDAERVAVGHGVLSALPASLMAQVHYEHGALNEAEAVIQKHFAAIRACGTFEAAVRAYRVLARIAVCRNADSRAETLLGEAEALGTRRGWPVLIAMSLYEQVRLAARGGRMEQALHLVGRLDRLTQTACTGARPDVRRFHRWADARVSIEGGVSTQTVALVRELHEEVLSRGDLYQGVRIALELAGSLQRLGDLEEADRIFMGTLKLGSGAGLYQVFVDERELIAPLLERAFERARRPGSPCRELLPCMGALVKKRQFEAPQPPQERRPQSSESLSARESAVLRLVCRGLSNKRIALSLAIAPETVKAHVKRIFLKLEVCSRAQAVFRATSLGLLSDASGR